MTLTAGRRSSVEELQVSFDSLLETRINLITTFEICFFLWSLVSALAIFWILWHGSRYAPALKSAVNAKWPWGVLDVLGSYLVIALLPAVAITILENASPGVKSLGTLFAELLALGAILFWLGVKYHASAVKRLFSLEARSDSGEVFPPWMTKASLGLLTGLIAIPVILRIHVMSQVLNEYSHPTLEDMQSRTDLLLIVVQAIRAIVVASIIEELFYRGLLQGLLQRLQASATPSLESLLAGGGRQVLPVWKVADSPPPSWPIFASASLFALGHLNLGASAIPLFFFGLILGYLFRRSGSLLPCIACHSLLNAYSIAQILIISG